MIKSKYILYLCFLALLLISFFFRSVPFFWDGTFFSEVASSFFDGRYTPFDCPENLDNVTFPIYSTYLFIVWKIFSKTLFISHLALLPFLIGTVYEFYKFCKKFLDDTAISFALILLMLQPAFMTQSILMAYDIPLLYLFLLCLNLALEKRYTFYQIIVTLVALYSIRGLFLGISLFILMSIFNYKDLKWNSLLFSFKQHVLCLIAVTTWFIYHKTQTGWFIISPIHENTDEQVQSLSMMIRHAGFIIWKLIDLGQLLSWLILLIGTMIIYRQKRMTTEVKTLLLCVFIPLIITALFMIPFSNPISHRYFLFGYVLLIPAISFLLMQIKNKVVSTSFFLLCSLSLISGNFWLYPEKYGNGWDTSLKVIPYFELKDNMDVYISENKIAAEQVGTQYPLIADKRYSHLTETGFSYPNVWSGPIEKFDYFLFTNVINTDIPDQVEKVKKDWILLKRIESGQVYMELYSKK